MKSKNVRFKVLSIMMAIVMLFSVACSKNNQTSNNSTSGNETSGNSNSTAGKTDSTKNSESKSADDSKPDTWIADRTIQIQAYVDDIGYSLPKDQFSTAVMQELQKRTGIKIEFLYTPGEKDRYVMAAQLAAGNLPDMIVSYLNNSTRPEFPILYQAAQDGMFADISSYLKDSKVYSKYFEDDYLPADTYSNIMFREDFNGAVYFVHLSIDAEDTSTIWNPSEEKIGGLYIQTAILNDLGIDPTSIDSSQKLYELLKQIKAKGYKDNNGNAITPLGPKYWGGSFDSLDYVMPDLMWGVSDNYNITEDGKVLHEAQTDWVYKQIDYIRKLLGEGLMHQEFFTMDETRANELCENKSVAIISDVHSYTDIIYGSDDWTPLGPIANYTGNTDMITTGKGGYGQWAIPATTENPEEIVALMDYLSSYEGQLLCLYGVEGVTYDMVDGYPVLKEEVQTALDNNDSDTLRDVYGAAFNGSGVYGLSYLLTDIQNEKYFGEATVGSSGSETFKRAVELATEYPRTYKLVPGLKASAYLTELEDVNTAMSLLDYDDIRTQAFYADSQSEVEKIIEGFRTQLEQAGVQQFLDLVKEKYNENPDTVLFY